MIDMEYQQAQTRAKIGRPLSFDREVGLKQAMLVFWEHGYESTSIAALTKAMGVTAPSIYTAFGDKRQLFLASVQLYLSGPNAPKQIIAQATNAKAAVEALLNSAAIGYTGKTTPQGCLLASATVSCSAAAADVQEAVAGIRREIERHLCQKIKKDISAGRLDSDVLAEELAALLMAVILGMSTLARDGASREKLLKIIKYTMRAWPRRRR